MNQKRHREGLIKPRWYDGPLYGWFFDPLEREKEKIVSQLVAPGSRVLDAPSGTGALSFALAKKAKEVVGVDASSRMLAFALKQKAARAAGN
ncbi:MAG: class I SAM-dependent methyltransferase, partial [Desulfatibacillaceae bacterium]|nr:class I SAM-dependent methyltransferase [Desulfatibacillaceae bacterium]